MNLPLLGDELGRVLSALIEQSTFFENFAAKVIAGEVDRTYLLRDFFVQELICFVPKLQLVDEGEVEVEAIGRGIRRHRCRLDQAVCELEENRLDGGGCCRVVGLQSMMVG